MGGRKIAFGLLIPFKGIHYIHMIDLLLILNSRVQQDSVVPDCPLLQGGGGSGGAVAVPHCRIPVLFHRNDCPHCRRKLPGVWSGTRWETQCIFKIVSLSDLCNWKQNYLTQKTNSYEKKIYKLIIEVMEFIIEIFTMDLKVNN